MARATPGAVGPGNRAGHVAQHPAWPDDRAVHSVRRELASRSPLVDGDACSALRDHLATVARGEGLLLQGGDCAEAFGAPVSDVVAKVRTLTDMQTVFHSAGSLPVVLVGRMAGQYAKPRSSPTETIEDVTLPTYRGDSVNGSDFDRVARTPDPERLLRMYDESAATIDVLRRAGGAGPRRGTDRPAEIYTSHEALVLDYEEPLVRIDAATSRPYGSSGHLLWIGDRTRDPDGAHVEFASRVANPVAVKLGPTATRHDVVRLVERLDPDRVPGRLSFIARMGARLVHDRLPPLVETAAQIEAPVVWVCDPMHGNTVSHGGRKTRRLEDIVDEVHGFVVTHRRLGSHPGGLHVEMTGGDVTECLGGRRPVSIEDLHRRYETACDPRLNRSQSLDVATLVAEAFQSGRGR